MSDSKKAVVLGISGCSSSGKTTLSRLLRDIFPHTFVLHEDDFYRPEEDLLSIYAKKPTLDSKEDKNSIGECPVSDEDIEALKSKVKTWTQPGQPGHGILTDTDSPIRLCIFDGFLLYSKSLAAVQSQIDLKLFLRVSYEKAKGRREARSGYVTLEGFWEDPPGYVDKIVWPNYVEDHKWMFEGGDVEGKLKKDVVSELGLKCQDGGLDIDMSTTLKWAVATVMESLPSFAKGDRGTGR